jgi:uncharacterized protein YtpQ (UPF0354 family)
MNTILLENCTQLGLNPTLDQDTLTVSLGSGLMKREVSLTVPQPPGHVDEKQWFGSVARGVLAALAEPKNSKGKDLDFVDATSRISASLEGPGFVEAAEEVLGEPLWTRPFVGDIVLAYRIDLDNGQRLLPSSQVEDWDVHGDRIHKAAVSIIFHRSGYHAWNTKSYDEMTVDEFQKGDGCDAARATILDMLDYHRTRSGVLFACPTADHLIFTDDEEDTLSDFRKLAERLYHESSFPLSDHVFAYRDGKLIEEPVGS